MYRAGGVWPRPPILSRESGALALYHERVENDSLN